MHSVAELRIRVELNKGRKGIPLDKLASVGEETVRFLNMLAADLGLGPPDHNWLAENFANGSVEFDCRFTHALDTPVLLRGQRALRAVFDNDHSAGEISVLIRPETRRQYARISRPIDPDEVVRFGLYSNGHNQPQDWFELTKRLSEQIEEPFTGRRESYGEIQAIVHAFFKETDRPYLKMREMSTRQLVNCYFPPEMYRSAVEVLEDPDAVVFVEGWLKEDPETGYVTDMEVSDFRPAPTFSEASLGTVRGSMPDYTGGLTTKEFLQKLRHE
jgi:hypothetical protein